MPTQLQLEGPDLETLLSRVKAEHGPGARIVRAEKVRTGGVAGFFARERFELCVELDVPAAGTARPPAQPAPLLDMPDAQGGPFSLLDLADQVSAAERSTSGRSTSGRRSAGVPQRRSTDGPADDRPLVDRMAPPVSSAPAPAGSTASGPAASSPEVPVADAPVSTETPSFASILARLGVAAGPGDEPLAHAEARGAHAPSRNAGAGDSVAIRSAGAHPGAADPSAVRPAGARSVSSAFRALEAFERADAPPAEAPAPAPLATLPRQRVADEPGRAVSVRRSAEIAVAGVERVPSPPLTGVCGQLAQLGLPDHLLPVPAAGPVYPSLVQSLRRLPKVPRTANRAGGVLAVVGPQALALDVARELARDLGVPVATAVVLATTRRGRADLPAKQVVRSAAAAVERRAAWRRRRNVTIVAVDAPLTAAGAATARAFLTALQPAATWGVVEATRKAHDVGRWTRALGGVDALALTAVEETADPASVLALGIPVGRLGTVKATPATWAALLTDRMAA